MAAAAIIEERVAEVAALGLKSGAHRGLSDGMCAMEAASYIAGEPWSDSPQCVSPVIGAFMRSWNDALPDDERNALITPALIVRTLNTRGSAALEERRSMMAIDWYIREHVPAFLRLAGMTTEADTLAALSELTAQSQMDGIRAPLEAIQKTASAAESAARSAAESAARSAAWSAARSAAESAARSAARSAAESAARSAAWSAAWSAARSAAWSAARSAAWSAAESAARSAARSAAWSAARSAAESAAWSAAESAAESAARSAAWSAARSAAESAARSAAWSAAWSAAESAAWSAAESAAESAARSAARSALAETRATLQQSALGLIERMCAATDADLAA